MASTSQSQPFNNPRALQSHNNSCLVSKTHCHGVKGIASNYQRENMKTGLPNCHHSNSTGFSTTCRHIQNTKSSPLKHYRKRSSSRFQYRALVQEHRQAVPKSPPYTASSHLHLRLNTSKDIRKLRGDGSPFQVTWRNGVSRPWMPGRCTAPRSNFLLVTAYPMVFRSFPHVLHINTGIYQSNMFNNLKTLLLLMASQNSDI